MGRYLSALLVVFTFTLQGCEAFKNYYDAPPPEVLESVGVEIDDGPGGNIPNSDFYIDETVCDTDSSVEVVYPEVETMEFPRNSGWTVDIGEGGTVTADVTKLGDHSVSISINKSGASVKTLTFTMKQTGETAMSVCNIVYSACVGECFGVTSAWSEIESGSIRVKAFDMESGIVTFYYTLKFKESNMGDPGIELEGSFTSNGFGREEIKILE